MKVEFAAQALNGESPRWSEQDNRLYWVDTRRPSVHAYDPHTSEDISWELPSWVGCGVLGQGLLLLALRTGLFEFRFEGAALRQVALAPYDSRRFIFNDGGCDPVGRFLVGEMYLPLAPGDEREHAPKRAPLYRFAGGTWVDMAGSTKTSNGLAWSPDGATMYQSDTAASIIYVFDYDLEDAQAHNRRIFAQVERSSSQHGPDGAAVDCEGFYWTAIFGEGCLLRFDPQGKLERRIDLPVRFPTMPAFGGSDYRTIFITSANWPLSPSERSARTEEGTLLSMDAPCAGLPTNLYDPRA